MGDIKVKFEEEMKKTKVEGDGVGIYGNYQEGSS
jgi:hypothetical protein